MIAWCITHKRGWFFHDRDDTCITLDERDNALNARLDEIRAREQKKT